MCGNEMCNWIGSESSGNNSLVIFAAFPHSLIGRQNMNCLKHSLAPMIEAGLLGDSSKVREVVMSCLRVGELGYAVSLLKQADECCVSFLWNTVIRAYERSRDPWRAVELYFQMLGGSVLPDKFTFPFALKACASIPALREGEQIHCRAVKSRYGSDLFVQGSLLFMYSSCRRIEAARAVFYEMPHKNLVSWNMMINGYVKHGDLDAASELFSEMPEHDLFSWNVMIDGFAKCGRIEPARRLFDDMPERDTVSWNSMMDAYIKYGNMEATRELFDLMPIRDEVSWGVMLNGYAKCGKVVVAHTWFEKLPYKNSVTSNSLISGYVKCEDLMSAHKLFELMTCRNLTSWNLIIDAYAKYGEMEIAWRLFTVMPIKDVFSWNIIIDGYVRIGRMDVAKKLFEAIPSRDAVSWNTMIAGYRQNGQPKEAIELYMDMHLIGFKPDCFTLASVLSAVADLGLYVQGRWIHDYINSNQFPLDGVVGVALIDMHSKCGYVGIAKGIFDSIPKKNKDHWNAMISGLAVHGYGHRAVRLFGDMERSNIRPDDITFIGILSACSHAGLVHEGRVNFENMSLKYGIVPKIQHYGCMVDLLSRAGNLEDAIALVTGMPMRANDVVWRALLSASRNHGNLEIAELAARHLIGLVPHDSSSYVLLSNIYKYKGKCQYAGEMWRIMKEKGVVKIPGSSSIELQGVLHEFTAGDTSHPHIFETCLLLHQMTGVLTLAGYAPSSKHSLFDTDADHMIPL